MDDQLIKNPDNKPFFRKAEKMTDRELQEMSLFYQSENLKATLKIKNNVAFFFYLTIAGIIIGFLSTIM